LRDAISPIRLEERGRGEKLAAARPTAVDAAIAAPDHRTRDLGGPPGTKAFAAPAIAGLVESD